MRSFPLRITRFRWVTAIGAVGIFAFLAFRYLVLSWPVAVIFRDSISIPEGASTYQVAHLLKKRDLIPNEKIFVNAVRLKFDTRAIEAGNFQLFNVRHIGDLVEQILRPRIKAVTITIPEGLTREQVARFINAKYLIDITNFLALSENEGFIRSLDLEVQSLEGYLFPDTYRIRNGSTEEEIIALMVRHVKQALDEEISRQGLAIGLSPHEILTMASIIEGEARYDSERVIISAVYHNRLRRGIHLQADPTVQYAIPDSPRRLLYRDYEYPSAYNTYLHKGLPPGPVNNPGRASILAAVSPADVDFLYFVANGQGQHVFSYTLDEHKQVVRDLRR